MKDETTPTNGVDRPKNDRLPEHVIIGDAHTHETPDVKVGDLYRIVSMNGNVIEEISVTEFGLHAVDCGCKWCPTEAPQAAGDWNIDLPIITGGLKQVISQATLTESEKAVLEKTVALLAVQQPPATTELAALVAKLVALTKITQMEPSSSSVSERLWSQASKIISEPEAALAANDAPKSWASWVKTWADELQPTGQMNSAVAKVVNEMDRAIAGEPILEPAHAPTEPVCKFWFEGQVCGQVESHDCHTNPDTFWKYHKF